MIPVVEELQGERRWTTPTGGRSRSAPASAATSPSSPPPPTSPPPAWPSAAGRPIRFIEFLKVGVPATLLSLVLATALHPPEVRLMPRTIADARPPRRTAPARRPADRRRALELLLDSGLPALPVVDADERYAGIFGEREFITALFPGYVGSPRARRLRPEVDRGRAREAPDLPPGARRPAHEHRAHRRRRPTSPTSDSPRSSSTTACSSSPSPRTAACAASSPGATSSGRSSNGSADGIGERRLCNASRGSYAAAATETE